MSRAIKFRIWDKRTNQWAGHADFAGEIHCDRENYPYVWSLTNPVMAEFFEVMQFTGRHDKDDKALYEGDIVVIYYWLNGEVERTRRDVIGFDFGKFDFKNPTYRETLRGSDIKIIGNIYEDKELLDA